MSQLHEPTFFSPKHKIICDYAGTVQSLKSPRHSKRDVTENCEQYCWKVEHVPHSPDHCQQYCRGRCLCFPQFSNMLLELLSVDGSATHLPAILLAILLAVDASLGTIIKKVVSESFPSLI